MDVEPTTKVDRKTQSLLKKKDIESLSSPEQINRSTIFDFLYFWCVFFLSASFFIDLTVFFCFYQKKNNDLSYKAFPFSLRIITDVIFIMPLLLFIRFALNDNSKNYLIGIAIFFPQFILSLISIIVIHNQDFVTEDDIKNNSISNITNLNEFVFYNILNNNNDTNGNQTFEISTTKLTDTRVSIIKISPIINLIFYLLTALLTYLKIYKNF